jgi:hypothetical protein
MDLKRTKKSKIGDIEKWRSGKLELSLWYRVKIRDKLTAIYYI